MNTLRTAQNVDDFRRKVVLACLVAVPVVFWRAPISSFQLPKFSILVVGLVALVGLAVFRIAVTGRLERPGGVVAPLLAAFLILFAVSTVTSSNPWVSFFGQFNRWGGLVQYVAVAAVFLTVLLSKAPGWPRRIAGAMLLGSSAVVFYGLMQWVGLDPINWAGATRTQNVFSTQGNGNWASTVIAIPVPLAVYFAFSRSQQPVVRVLALVYPVLAALVIYASRGAQGGVAAAVALAVMGAAVLTPRALAAGRGRSIVIAGGAVVLLLVVLFAAIWPRLDDRANVANRLLLWETAWSITAEQPVVGVGPETYIHHFYRHRPEAHVERFGESITDAPHSVPLGMFYGGGWPLGLAYVAFVAAVGWTAMRRLLRPEQAPDLLFASAVGAWAGFQAQSLISIDVPTLALYHFTLAGLIVLLAQTEPARETALVQTDRATRSRPWLSPRATATVLAAILAASAWFLLRPLRADLAAANGARLAAQGDLESGLEQLRRATSLSPWQSTYWFQLAVAVERTGDGRATLQALEQAARTSHGAHQNAVLAADLADRLGDTAKAAYWYQQAARWNPKSEAVVSQAVAYLQSHGYEDEAESLEHLSVRTES